MPTKALKLRVQGRVQRVGYRRYVLDKAIEEGVGGYAKNEKDGSVFVFVQGDRLKVDRFVDILRNPPLPAVVKEVKEAAARPLPRLGNFTIKFGPLAEEFQEAFGGMQTEFSDYREEFRGFAAKTDANFKDLGQRYGEISEKLTKIMDALTEESKKSREMLEEIREESKHGREMLREMREESKQGREMLLEMREESKQGREALAKALELFKDALDRLPRQQ